VRPAEPCSVSVAATHQLLTQILELTCFTVISSLKFRIASGAVITRKDLGILERCNIDNISALQEIVSVDVLGKPLDKADRRISRDLRNAGGLWSKHVLENAKAYIMSVVYIIVTVTSGFPLVSALAILAGADGLKEWVFYLIRFLDSHIYIFLPQINIVIIWLIEGQNLLHRMVDRTVVIGDCPWISQCAEAFLGKIFACSYSIAGLNVLSGNPADHLVHRHTHRVV
jgi:hypothetical protein